MFKKKETRNLYLIRHGQAETGGFHTPDRDRLLTKRGEQDTQLVWGELVAKNFMPDLILCSDAQRALKSAQRIAQVLHYPTDLIQQSTTLYLAEDDQIYLELSALPDSCKSVVLVGHNPGLTDFVLNALSEDQQQQNQVALPLPTSGLVGLQYKANHWNELAAASCKVIYLAQPFI